VTVDAGSDPATPGFRIRAEGLNARVTDDVAHAFRGEAAQVDARHVQPFLTYKLSRTVNAAITLTPLEGAVELVAG
jgi:hypothetical protein